MKKLLPLLLLLVLTTASYSQENDSEKIYFEKTFGFKMGVQATYTANFGQSISLGPNIGFAWEKWRTRKRGFITELHFGYVGKIYDFEAAEMENHFYFAVPVMWGFRPNEHFAFKIGLQPDLLINTKSGEVPVIVNLQLPLSFTYYVNKKFYLDFKLGLPVPLFYPGVFFLPMQSSLCVTAGWRMFK